VTEAARWAVLLVWVLAGLGLVGIALNLHP
jgi:hypothetical protein